MAGNKRTSDKTLEYCGAVGSPNSEKHVFCYFVDFVLVYEEAINANGNKKTERNEKRRKKFMKHLQKTGVQCEEVVNFYTWCIRNKQHSLHCISLTIT